MKDSIFLSKMDIKIQKISGYLNFILKYKNLNLNTRCFSLSGSKRDEKNLKKRVDFHFLFLKTKNKITRRQKRKNACFFHILRPSAEVA